MVDMPWLATEDAVTFAWLCADAGVADPEVDHVDYTVELRDPADW